MKPTWDDPSSSLKDVEVKHTTHFALPVIYDGFPSSGGNVGGTSKASATFMAIDDGVSSSSSKVGKEKSNQGEANRYTSSDSVR